MRSERRDFLKALSEMLGVAALSQRVSAAKTSRADRLHIGDQTNTFGVPVRGYDHLLRILDILADLRYQGFETNQLSLAPYADRAIDLRKAFESRRVPLIAPHAGGKLGPEKSKEDADAELERLHRIAGWGAQMGAKYLVFSGATLRKLKGTLDMEQIHRRMADLNQLGRICQQEGVQLCYHNERQDFQSYPSEMSVLLRETDPKLVRLCLDVGNGYGLGEHPGRFSARHFRRIAMYHLKDVKRNAAGDVVPVNLGAGSINLRAVVAPVLNSDWRGWLTVEREADYPRAAANPEQLLKQCRAYIRQITGV
jgi:sugar phosphate isomerase/epimerase